MEAVPARAVLAVAMRDVARTKERIFTAMMAGRDEGWSLVWDVLLL